MKRKQVTTTAAIVLSCVIGLGGNVLFSSGPDTVDRRLMPCDVPMILLAQHTPVAGQQVDQPVDQPVAGQQMTVIAQPASGFHVALSLGGGKALPLVRMAISYLDAPRLSGENPARLR
jgi:hypothetical protein